MEPLSFFTNENFIHQLATAYADEQTHIYIIGRKFNRNSKQKFGPQKELYMSNVDQYCLPKQFSNMIPSQV